MRENAKSLYSVQLKSIGRGTARIHSFGLLYQVDHVMHCKDNNVIFCFCIHCLIYLLLHFKNILNSQNALGLGLDIGTLIDVRRAQLEYKLSDEVTLLLKLCCCLFAFSIFGLKSTSVLVEQCHFISML